MDLRKTGIKVFLFTLLLIILASQIGVPMRFRLFAGSFGFGTSLFLMLFKGYPED